MDKKLRERLLLNPKVEITEETKQKLKVISNSLIKPIIQWKVNIPLVNLSSVLSESIKIINDNFLNLEKSLKTIELFKPDNITFTKEQFNRLIKGLELREKEIHKSVSAKTKTLNKFDFNLILIQIVSPQTNILMNDLKILRNKLHNKRDVEYSENVEMAYEFASNLNEIFIYFNNFLLKTIVELNIPYDIYGKESGQDSNNVQKMLKKIINEVKSSEIRDKLKEIKRYFSLLEVIIRHFYSHGWLNIFPLICLQNINLWDGFSLQYKISGEDRGATDISLKFFDIDKFEKELEDLFEQYFNEKDVIKFFENYTINKFEINKINMMRNFLRKISLSEGIKKHKYCGFPNEIHIYNVDNNEPLILSEEKSFEQINKFIEIIDKIINEKDKKVVDKE